MGFSLDQSNPLMKKQLFIHHWLLGGLTLFRLHTRRVTPFKGLPNNCPHFNLLQLWGNPKTIHLYFNHHGYLSKKKPKDIFFFPQMHVLYITPSCFVCPSFQFRMSKYIVCYEKLIDTISITFLTYLYLKSQYSHRFIIA